MKRTLQFLLLFVSFNYSAAVWAHGDDKLGPNGGFLRMPSNFHTELVPIQDTQFRVYLTDIKFQNPTLEKAELKVVQKVGGQDFPVTCTKADKSAFICTLSKGQNLLAGELVVESQRLGQKGVPVTYALPLKVTEEKDEHKHHH